MPKFRKPSRGVCGFCGCPVEAPAEVDLKPPLLGQLTWEVNGHQYDYGGYWKTKHRWTLLLVRCPAHGGHGF